MPFSLNFKDFFWGVIIFRFWVSISLHWPVVFFPPQARADMNHPDSHCHTPLHLASDEGHLDVVRSLVASKAAKDEKFESGDGRLSFLVCVL